VYVPVCMGVQCRKRRYQAGLVCVSVCELLDASEGTSVLMPPGPPRGCQDSAEHVCVCRKGWRGCLCGCGGKGLVVWVVK
jgi:hypothetical protein